MSHPTQAEWEAYLADRVSPAEAKRLEAHHAACPECQAVVDDLARPAAPPRPTDAPSDVGSLLRRAHIAVSTRAGGLTIDGYEILGELGSGGMGVVYRVQRPGTDQTYALKTLHPGVRSNPEARERFAREIELLCDNAGPGVVRVVEHGEADGGPYVVLELAAGGSLADRLAEFQQAPLQLARVLAGVARTLDRLHAAGLVHRDIKPGNILLGYVAPDPAAPPPINPPLDRLEPILADFGLTVQVPDAEADGRLTGSRAVLGTFDHIAPEQARDPRAAGPRSDVFSLGTVLYKALTGQAPFGAATMYDTLRRLDRDEPARPSSLNQRAANDLQRIALRCLEKDPAKRYPSAAALADDLDRFRAGDRLDRATPSYSRGMLFWRWCRRHPAVSIPVALAAGLLVATAVVSLFYARAEGQRSAAVAAEGRAERERALQDLIASADAAARRGEWRRAVRLYTEAIATGRDDALELRVRRLPGYFTLNDAPALDAELAALTDGRDLGPHRARVLLAQGDWVMCDQARVAEGKALVREALADGGDLTPADRAYAEALLCDDLRDTLARLGRALTLDRLHARAGEVYLLTLILVGEFDAAQREATLYAALFPSSRLPLMAETVTAALGGTTAFGAKADRLTALVRETHGPAEADRVREFLDRFVGFIRQAGAPNPLAPANGSRPEQAQRLLGMMLVLNRQAAGAPGPLVVGLPVQGQMRTFLEAVPALMAPPTEWTPATLARCEAVARVHPEALLPCLVMAYHLGRTFPALNQGNLPAARTELEAAIAAARRARSSPTLYANFAFKEQARVIECLCRIGLLKLFPDAADAHLKPLLADLPAVAQDLGWTRRDGLKFLVALLTAPPTAEQIAAWDLSTADGRSAFVVRQEVMIRGLEAALDAWSAADPKAETKALREGLKKLRETLARDPAAFRFVPGKK